MKLLLRIDKFVRKHIPSQWLDRVGGYDVFVSYSQRDGIKYAESVTESARREGLTVFRDNDGIRDGEDIPDRIVCALNRAKFLLVVATPQAVESNEVRKERELYLNRKTIFRTGRPIAIVYPGHDVSIHLENIKAIRTDGTVEGVTVASLAAIKAHAGWSTSLQRLYTGLLTTGLVITFVLVLLGRSLSASRTETLAQRWEAIAQAAEKDYRYSEAESAYRNGSSYAVRLNEEADRMVAYRHLIPLRRVSKPPDSECRFVTQLNDGRILAAYRIINSGNVSIHLDGEEVSMLKSDSESSINCDWVEDINHGWTLAVSNGEQLWIVESAGSDIPKTMVSLDQTHACFCVLSDGSVQAMTVEDDLATVHRLKMAEEPKKASCRPARNLVGGNQSHVTYTTVLCGIFSSSQPREAFVIVAASPQSDRDSTCQIDIFKLETKENDFELVASLPLQSITASAKPLGNAGWTFPYDEPLTAEGLASSASGLTISTDQSMVAFQFVQSKKSLLGKPFHVIMPAKDFSQNAEREWQAAHKLARGSVYVDGNAVDSISLVDHPFPAAVIQRNDLVQFIRLDEPPSVMSSMTTDAEHCKSTDLFGIRSPVLINSTSKNLETFKAEHRVCYSLPDLSGDILAIHGDRSSLIVVENPDSLFCFKGWDETAAISEEGASAGSDRNGYMVNADGHVGIPAFETTTSAQ